MPREEPNLRECMGPKTSRSNLSIFFQHFSEIPYIHKRSIERGKRIDGIRNKASRILFSHTIPVHFEEFLIELFLLLFQLGNSSFQHSRITLGITQIILLAELKVRGSVTILLENRGIYRAGIRHTAYLIRTLFQLLVHKEHLSIDIRKIISGYKFGLPAGAKRQQRQKKQQNI